MAYIGREPVIGNFVKLDAITAVNGQAAYTMQNGGVNFTSYDNVNQFLVSLNGVLQAPTDSFTVSGSTLTFASNLSTGDVIDFVLVLGNSLDIGTPSDNTVSLAKLTATGTKDATTFLRGDNTFAAAGVAGISSSADATAITIDSSENVSMSQNVSFNSGFGSATTVYGCRAWVRFDGTGTVAIDNSGGVSSLTDNSTGNYTVNFTTNMPDINYAAIVSPGAVISTGSQIFNYTSPQDPSSVSGVTINNREVDNDSSGFSTADNDCIMVAVFR